MPLKRKRLVLQQLEAKVDKIRQSAVDRRPLQGWIRAIREALGMTGQQLGVRLGVAQPRISRLEQDELVGSVTLKTMHQVAEAMACEFVYAIVPRTTLEAVVRKQARFVAEGRLNRASHSMLLEDQELSSGDKSRLLADFVEDLVRERPKDLWRVRDVDESPP